MTAKKDFGISSPPGRYLTTDDRAWETVVFEPGKPVLDIELNLGQDISTGAAQEVLKRSVPSGWLMDDGLTTSNPVSGIFNQSSTSNVFEIPNGILAHVNGWVVKVQNSYVNGTNRITLPAAPSSGKRAEFIVLEVWRQLLAPGSNVGIGSAGKPTSSTIWSNGNVTGPNTVPDDLQNTAVNAETTRRVQIQYRLRVVSGVDIFSHPQGYTDPAVFANSVPAAPGSPNGVATTFHYTSASSLGDSGLWVAGDGDPDNTLNTVDGYVYSIPLMVVFRRNTAGFNILTNQNGGVNRPDGLVADRVYASDVFDMRNCVSLQGWNLQEVLDKNYNFVLDNSLRTEIGTMANPANGGDGTTLMTVDEIGVAGSGGDTTGGTLIGRFDGVRRIFSDRATSEVMTLVITRPGGWTDNDQVVLDPSATNSAIYPYGSYGWSGYVPANVRFMGVFEMYFAGAAAPKKNLSAEAFIQTFEGLGSGSPPSVTFTGLQSSGGLTNEALYVKLLISYPSGSGLSKTPLSDQGFNFLTTRGGTLHTVTSADLPASTGVAAIQMSLDKPHREVSLEYTTANIVFTIPTPGTSNPYLHLPERAVSVSSVKYNSGSGFVEIANPTNWSLVTTTAGLGIAPSQSISLSGPHPQATGTYQVTYVAQRPFPPDLPATSTDDLQLYIQYKAAANQMARIEAAPATLRVIPKLVSPRMTVLTAGCGSQDEGYPFPQSYVQTGGCLSAVGSSTFDESDMAAYATVSVADFNANTAMLQLPVYVPMVANPEELQFTNRLVDQEGRTFYSSIPSSGTYVPNAYAQDLSTPSRHKNILPILAELAEDYAEFGVKGQLVLVLLIRYAAIDEVNSVGFDLANSAANNTTTASVFRVKGNLLNKR